MSSVIITGASAGIGAAVAASFVARGSAVFNLSRRPCPVDGVVSLTCDLADSDSRNSSIGELAERIDWTAPVTLVHNASRMNKDATDSCDDAALRAVLEINIVAVNHLNRSLLPSMGAGSSILYVGSTLAEKAVAGSFSYVTSKHAQLGAMRATCQDLQGRGIHTAMICPGFTDTEMLRKHLGNDEDTLRAIGATNGFGRLVDPREIADLILWCADHPVINGAVLHANLGQKES